jgi:hypothetical protein
MKRLLGNLIWKREIVPTDKTLTKLVGMQEKGDKDTSLQKYYLIFKINFPNIPLLLVSTSST